MWPSGSCGNLLNLLNLLCKTNASVQKLNHIFNTWLETRNWLSGSSSRALHQVFKSAFIFQCFVESWQGQHDISVTCVTLVGTLNLCISILSPGVTPALPALSAAAQGTAGTNTNLWNVYCLPSSILLLVFLYGGLQGKLALLIPFSTLGIYLVMFRKVLSDWITFSCSCMTQSDSCFHWNHLRATMCMERSNPVYVPLSWENVQNILCVSLSHSDPSKPGSAQFPPDILYLIAKDKLIFIYKMTPFLLLPWKHLSGWCLSNCILKNLCNINN